MTIALIPFLIVTSLRFPMRLGANDQLARLPESSKARVEPLATGNRWSFVGCASLSVQREANLFPHLGSGADAIRSESKNLR